MNKHCLEVPPEFALKVEEFLPIDPRDAYKGGKVEVFKLVHDAPLQMCDFVSEYPTTLLGNSFDPLALENPDTKLIWPFPVGIPEIWSYPPLFKYDLNMVGLIKCTVLPPRQLYAPFLSMRVYSTPKDYEVLYGLCRTCMIDRSWPCTHDDESRQFSGTWTLPEMDHAISLGYRVIRITEMWVYPGARTDLFRNFISPFMVEKILSKRAGLVNEETGEFTEKGVKVNTYLTQLSGREYPPSAFTNSPAKRTVAKLAQNSFTGKWGEIEVHRSSKVYTPKTAPGLWKMFNNSDVQMRYATILDENRGLIVAEYEMRSIATRTCRKKNDIIVSYITAYGRIMLSRLEQKLGHNLIYEDTDSAFHSMLPTPAYIDGFRTGDLELELKEANLWVSLGRKWYTYVKPGDRVVSKLKGFTLRRKETELTSSIRLKAHLSDVIRYLKESDGASEVQVDPIEIEQHLFETIGGNNPLQLQKKTRMVEKKVQFFASKMKRFVDLLHLDEPLSFVDSFPFGY
jgi:hypothetical protein